MTSSPEVRGASPPRRLEKQGTKQSPPPVVRRLFANEESLEGRSPRSGGTSAGGSGASRAAEAAALRKTCWGSRLASAPVSRDASPPLSGESLQTLLGSEGPPSRSSLGSRGKVQRLLWSHSPERTSSVLGRSVPFQAYAPAKQTASVCTMKQPAAAPSRPSLRSADRRRPSSEPKIVRIQTDALSSSMPSMLALRGTDDRQGTHQIRMQERDPEACKHGMGTNDAGFPRTGKPITVKLMCMRAESSMPMLIRDFKGIPVTSNWELSHLLQVSEHVTGVHRDAQKLYHAGREICHGCTIRDAVELGENQLPAKFAVHVVINEDRFPQKLGPFGILSVPLEPDDFQLPRSTSFGFHWTMKEEVVQRHGIRIMGDAPITAQCSPTHPVTLSEQERLAVGILPEVVDSAWSYPIANWDMVERNLWETEDLTTCAKAHSAVKDFLVVGGFIYLDKDHRIVQVTTPCLNMEKRGGLQFKRPQQWDPLWTKPLLEDGRFHRTTISPLKEAGVRFFCWLRPGEILEGEDGTPLKRQPELPHGGFAYLFHEITGASPRGSPVDCYFPIASVSEHSRNSCESFPVVGEEPKARKTPPDL